MIRSIAALAALFAIASVSRSETMEERGKRIVNEAVTALGGDNFLNIQNITESGRLYSFYREQLSGLAIGTIYREFRKPSAPDKLNVVERESFAKSGRNRSELYAVLFTASEAWDISFRGARPLPADRFPRYKLTTMHDIFYILRERLHEPGMILVSQGSDVLDNRPVEIVDNIDANNEKTTVYFDQTTKVPIRQKFYHLDPLDNQQDEEITYYTKYRDIGNGVQWPFDLQREHNGDKIFELFADSVTVNKDLSEKLFMLPSDIKILERVD
jgi:hypothetical protein